MKKSFLILFSIFLYIGASCQDDKTFDKEIKANGGITTIFLKFSDGTNLTSKPVQVYPGTGIAVSTGTAWGTSIVDNSVNWNAAYSWGNHAGRYELLLGNPSTNGYVLSSTTSGVRSWVPMTGGGTMVYPAAGIPLSTGTAWGTSVVNNSTNWNTAYSWGNHAGLYKPVSYVPTWAEITGKPTFATVATTGKYSDLLSIPTTFAPTSHTHDYNTDITNKPPTQDLGDAIKSRDYLEIPSKTTTQINSFVMPTGATAIVYDSTLKVYKVYKDGVWSIVITQL